MEKISRFQLAAMFVLSRLFSEAMSFPLDEVRYSMQRFTVILAAKIILFAVFIPLIVLAQRKVSVFGAAYSAAKPLGWITGIVFSLFAVFTAAITLSKLDFYVSSTVFSDAPASLIITAVVIVCAYALYKGAQGVARFSVVILTILAVFVLTVALSLGNYCDMSNFYPDFLENPDGLPGQIISELGKNPELIFFAVLASNVREKAEQTAFYIIPVLLITELMIFLETAVLGAYLEQLNFPFYMLSSMSDVVVFQRLDGIDVTVWIFACIIKISLCLLTVFSIFIKLRGKKTAYIVSCGALALLFVSALLLSDRRQLTLNVVSTLYAAGLPIILLCSLLALILIFVKGKNSDETTNA